jgi:hypothetical protein
MNPLTEEMEAAYQQFLAKRNLTPGAEDPFAGLLVKMAFLDGYVAGHEAAHQYWSAKVDKMVQGICIA